MSEPLDTIDAKILDLIQQDASLSVADIAERVGLSSSPCWRRIKRMEEAGIIQGRVTLLDRQALGLGFEVVANVKLALPSKDNLEAFEPPDFKSAEHRLFFFRDLFKKKNKREPEVETAQEPARPTVRAVPIEE